MTPYRIHDRIKYQGSTGTLQHLNPDGSWRVWFAAKDWTGDPAMIHIDRLVKLEDNHIRKGAHSWRDYETGKFHLEELGLDSIQYFDACVIIANYLCLKPKNVL